MSKVFCALVTGALAVLAMPADAVVLNPRGTGQVLVYPYYTVNAGFGTLFSVVNTTAHGKALKMRFREGYNGRYVLDFNLYLAPFDVWVGQIFDTSADGTGVAAIATSDNSCTVPVLPDANPGLRAVSFRDAEYSGANGDGGPSGPTRTREGYFEIIEMGEVIDATQHTLSAITHDQAGVPVNCKQLNDAWAGGYWRANPKTDLTPPAGGLYGAESIINVAEGTIYTVNATAIDGFSDVVQHTVPGDESGPDLNTASANADGLVSAFVPVGASMVQADFQKPEDAISALLMANNLFNEFVVDPGVGATSDWIVTFPTKRFYTDPDLLAGSTQARRPFDVLFTGLNGGGSSAGFDLVLANREEDQTLGTCGAICPTGTGYAFSYAANAIPFGTTGSTLDSHLQVSNAPTAQGYGFTGGHALVDFTSDFSGGTIPTHALSSSNDFTFRGLPAVGFLAINYVNANVTPGVLANYGGAYPHRAAVACARSSNPQSSCP